MFSLSSKSTYGLEALLDLANHYGKELVQIKDIVERRKIPRNYLEQILNNLTKNRIIHGVRGKDGGYELTRSPDSISVLDVLEAVDGSVQLNDSKDITAIQSLYKEVENKIKEGFRITLSDLLERQHNLETMANFQI